MAHQDKVSRRHNENLLRLLIDGSSVGCNSTYSVGGLVNVYVVQGSALGVHQSDEDVHDIEGQHSLCFQRVESTRRSPIFDLYTISVSLLSPVLQSF